MQNIDIKVTGQTMVITVDLSKRLGPSKSGKTQIIATTAGAATVNGPKGAPVKVGLNVYV
jgi:hypothetical protein